MATHTEITTSRLARPWRIALWSVIAGLLLLPAGAMRLTTEVVWTATDFVFAGAVMITAGVLFEVAMATLRTPFYRVIAGVAILGFVLIIWAAAVSEII